MKPLSVSIEVRRYRNRKEFGGVQCLERAVRVFGVCVWRTELDKEDVPAWAEIQAATLGSTEWRSKFAEYIK